MKTDVKQKKDWFFGTSQNLPKIVEIDLPKIRPNPDQPRKTFKEEGIRELASSIEQHGLIQPITVMRDEAGDGYILVTGERRYRAHQLLNKETIFSIILTSGNTDELSLIENVQREDLNPIEEAEALAKLMERYSYTQEQLGKVIGKAQNTISTLLRLNTLPAQIKHEYPTSDMVSKSILVEIARHEDPVEQLALWEQAKAGGITVRTTRTVKKLKRESDQEDKPRRRASPVRQTISMGRVFLDRLESFDNDALFADAKDGSEIINVCNLIRDRYYALFAPTDAVMDLTQQLAQKIDQASADGLRLKKKQLKKLTELREKLDNLLAGIEQTE